MERFQKSRWSHVCRGKPRHLNFYWSTASPFSTASSLAPKSSLARSGAPFFIKTQYLAHSYYFDRSCASVSALTSIARCIFVPTGRENDTVTVGVSTLTGFTPRLASADRVGWATITGTSTGTFAGGAEVPVSPSLQPFRASFRSLMARVLPHFPLGSSVATNSSIAPKLVVGHPGCFLMASR